MIVFTLQSAGRGKLHQGAQLAAFGFPVQGQSIAPPAPIPAIYRVLVDSFYNDAFIPANSTITEGADIPYGFTPNATMEPLNHQGLLAFRAAGPQLNFRDFFPATSFKLKPPATFWTIQNGAPTLITPLS